MSKTSKLILARDPSLLTEAQFSGLIVDVATLAGWKRYHTHNSRRSNFGFPDWVFVRGERLVFAELKREGGQPTTEQVAWLEALRGLEGPTKGLVQVYLWRPSDWDAIVETLTGRLPG